jgi:hypothetical protein
LGEVASFCGRVEINSSKARRWGEGSGVESSPSIGNQRWQDFAERRAPDQKPLLAHCFFEGPDVQWIDGSRNIVLADNYYDIFSDRDEIRVRNREMPSVCEVQSKRPKPVLHAFPDFLRIHRAIDVTRVLGWLKPAG